MSEVLREIVARLGTPTHALAALAAAMDSRVTGVPLDARVQPCVDEILRLLGAREAVEHAMPAELVPLLGEIRTFALTDAKLLFAASRSTGWRHDERALLEAAGAVSTAFPGMLAAAIAPTLEGLADRLASAGAAFLDVGVGVAAMSIEMARRFPALRIVGVDPWGPALAIARDRVHEARLADRIELRHQGAEALSEHDAFDLAWVPSAFIPAAAIAPIVRRVHAALRPGGWLLLPIMRPGDDPLAAAMVRLRTAMFGGWLTTPTEVEQMLRECFTTVRTLPIRPNALTAMVVARR